MTNETITDSIIAGTTTGTVHSLTNPNDGTTTIILSIITGIIAPLVKELVNKWNERRKERKASKKQA